MTDETNVKEAASEKPTRERPVRKPRGEEAEAAKPTQLHYAFSEIASSRVASIEVDRANGGITIRFRDHAEEAIRAALAESITGIVEVTDSKTLTVYSEQTVPNSASAKDAGIVARLAEGNAKIIDRNVVCALSALYRNHAIEVDETPKAAGQLGVTNRYEINQREKPPFNATDFGNRTKRRSEVDTSPARF